MSPARVDAPRRQLDAALAAGAAGRPAVASRHFRRVLELTSQPGGPDDPGSAAAAYVRARALLGLVMSEFELRADLQRGMALLDEAAHWAQVADAEPVRLAVLGQQGLLWLRAGDTPRAVALLSAMIARLDEAEPIDACVALLNRGSAYLDLGDVDAARADLHACAERAEAIGEVAVAFKARHNLGYAEFLAGDLPRALATMARAAESPGDVSPAIALLDRSQVLLEAGLVGEADETLARAGRLLAAQRLALDLAQVELARAQCALLLHRPEQALQWSRTARRRLARRGHGPLLAQARLAELRAALEVQVESARPDRRALATVARRAEALAAGREGDDELRRAALVVRAGALAVAGRVEPARAALTAAGRLTGRESLSLALSLHAVAAGLAFDSGRRAEGRRRVEAGQRLLAQHRRQLGSVEAVTAAAVLGERLALTEIGAALRRGDPLDVLRAVERGRATFAGPARVRPPQDERLAELLTDLRFVVERERLLPVEDVSARATARREADRLRAAARERAWELDGHLGAPEAPEPRALSDEVVAAGISVVDLVVHAGTVHAVTLDARGPRLHHLADAQHVERLATRVAADLQALSASLPSALRQVVGASLERGLAGLDAALLAPLDLTGPVHLAAGGRLVTLPWNLLPSRRGVATSVGTRLARGSAAAARPGVLAVAGPGLDHAETEAVAVARAWGPDATALTGAAAGVAPTVAALRSAGVVHLAVHGRHEPDNPLFSWVRLADGPLFAHELEGLDLGGCLVVLSACEVGRASVRPGGEVLGLASVLLRLGAESVVAALAPLADEVAARVAPRLHASVRDGLPPAQALAELTSGPEGLVPLACFRPRAGVAPGQVAPGREHGGR